MYKQAVAVATSARGERVEPMTGIRLYTWARQQMMRIEAMEALCADRLQPQSALWTTREPLTLALAAIAYCTPLALQYLAFAARAAQFHVEVQANYATLVCRWIEECVEPADAPKVRDADVPALGAPDDTAPSACALRAAAGQREAVGCQHRDGR